MAISLWSAAARRRFFSFSSRGYAVMKENLHSGVGPPHSKGLNVSKEARLMKPNGQRISILDLNSEVPSGLRASPS
jgi:hypothetical protein